MTRAPGGYLAFLDLTSCGFGCALILMLMVASVNSPPHGDQPRQRVLFVRFWMAGDGVERPEVVIECLRPGGREWERIRPDDPTLTGLDFSARSSADSGAEAVAVVYNPPPGKWAFRALLVGFPKAANGVAPGNVELDFRAEYDGDVPARGKQKPLRWPGETTPPVEVDVPPSP